MHSDQLDSGGSEARVGHPGQRFAWTIVAAAGLAASGPAAAVEVSVGNADALRGAVQAAQPGDEIVLADGVYLLDDELDCTVAGTPAAPIVVRSEHPLGAEIRFSALEGFRVVAPHWQFRDMVVRGVCVDDSTCEHAVHLSGDADFTVLRGNHLRDFNASLKANGSSGAFPDDVLVEGNVFTDTRPRVTSNPVAKIDVVGGRRWTVRGNTIANFHKNGGAGIAWGVVLRGGSRDGLIERNLVVCDAQDSVGTTVGLSLGGGGTSSFCEDDDCVPEHIGGTLRNNIVLHCNDVGIYLNKADDTAVLHNTLYATVGIDLRFAETSAIVANNLLEGSIRLRDGATATQSSNLAGVAAMQFSSWFVDPAGADFRASAGADLTQLEDAGIPAGVPDDFCGSLRDAVPDIGAVEYSAGECLTTVGGGGNLVVFSDGFED